MLNRRAHARLARIQRRGAYPAERAARGVRVRLLPRPAARDHRASDRRWRCRRADADRWWQVAVLPGAGAAAPWGWCRDLAADCADEGPGRRAAPGGSARGSAELTPRARRGCRDRTRSSRNGRRSSLCLARAAADAALPRAVVSHPAVPLCRRRGALHLAMGARFPSGIPATQDSEEALSRCPARGAHRDADGPTRRDIVDQLNLAEARIFAAGYDRPNLFYRVVATRYPL